MRLPRNGIPERLPALSELICHREWVPATLTLEEVFHRFSQHTLEYMAVLDGERCLGICSREAVSLTLGTLYGRACFAKSPITGHLQEGVLQIFVNQSITEILELVSAREGECFYEDVLLLDDHGRFQGLITTQRLIQLQQRMLEEYVRTLEQTNQQLDRHNRQMENDLLLARELQFSILPRHFPAMRYCLPPHDLGLDFQQRYQPSGSVGGDFFQIIPLDRDRVGLFLCDVMGHGVQAALVTAMIRALLEGLMSVAGEPAQLLSVLNRELAQMLKGSDCGLFATALYLVIDCRDDYLRFASAGHPPAFEVQQKRQRVQPLIDVDNESGAPLGILPEVAYRTLQYRQSRDQGDCLLLFTDGLYEVFDHLGSQLGVEGLKEILLRQGTVPLAQLLDGTLEAVRRYARGPGLDDDVCLLGLQWR